MTSAGSSGNQITEAVDVLKSAIQGTLQQECPRIDPGIVQKLVAGFELSYAEAITATKLVGILLALITAALVWFGLRGRADEPRTDGVARE